MKKILGGFIFIIAAVVTGCILFVLSGDKLLPGNHSTDGGVHIISSVTTDAAKTEASSNDKAGTDLLALVNKEHHLEPDYVPEDLVEVDVAFTVNVIDEEKKMRRTAAAALEKLFEGAGDEGIELCAVSGYRSFKYQKQIYNEKLKSRGRDYVDAYVAVPGQSEHQTGLAMDVGSFIPLNESNNYDFGQTKEGKWLKDNAYAYGFILRYPKGKEKTTGYNYEPWHIRFVGIEAAQEMKDRGVVLEEYLQ